MSELFTSTYRVYYEHTDAGGVVYHANYLNFMERCRCDWLESMGQGVVKLEREYGLQWVVRAAHLEFIAPARLFDELTVSCVVLHVGKVKLEVEQAIYNNDELLCSARIKLATLSNQSFRPLKMPNELLAALQGPN